MLVPHVVRCCVEEVERRGMDEVGIYRISGAASDISTLKAAFNSSKTAKSRVAWLQECVSGAELHHEAVVSFAQISVKQLPG